MARVGGKYQQSSLGKSGYFNLKDPEYVGNNGEVDNAEMESE